MCEPPRLDDPRPTNDPTRSFYGWIGGRFKAIRAAHLAACLVLAWPAPPARGANGELELHVTDSQTHQPIAVRMHLRDSRGRPRLPKGVPAWNDHFVFPGKIVLDLPPGRYTFDMERGPEYHLRTGSFLIRSRDADSKDVEMVRFADLKREGWWSGDLHVHRRLQDIELLMLAEDLHVAPVITWWNNRNWWADHPRPASLLTRFDGDRYYHVMAGEDERGGGALLYFNLPEPLPLAGSQREYPSPVHFLEMARRHPGVHVDVEKPFWWDAPTWVATGQIDSIGLANNHMQRNGMLDNEAWGRPRDRRRFPPPHGNGLWSQQIYYELLNCGLRIPPSAGSASGVLPNPVGYNRVYVYCGRELTWDGWWEGLREGRVVVTNGPLLRPLANGRPPGHVFRAPEGGSVELELQVNLALREPAPYLEIIKNGLVAHAVRLDEIARRQGRLPTVRFDESGWMLVRVVTDNQRTFRFASSGPFYVEIGGRRRVSKRSAQFFLDWVRERMRQIRLDDPEQQQAVLAPHRAAERFWSRLVESANAP